MNYIEQKIKELNHLVEVENASGATINLIPFLKSSLEEAIVKGIEMAEGAVEEIHKESQFKPRFPGGGIERELASQDKILHRIAYNLTQLKNTLV